MIVPMSSYKLRQIGLALCLMTSLHWSGRHRPARARIIRKRQKQPECPATALTMDRWRMLALCRGATRSMPDAFVSSISQRLSSFPNRTARNSSPKRVFQIPVGLRRLPSWLQPPLFNICRLISIGHFHIPTLSGLSCPRARLRACKTVIQTQ